MGEQLLEQFALSGFTGLVSDDAIQLIRYLEMAAQEGSGSGGLPYLAEAIRAVDDLRRKEDEKGGVRAGFLKNLDRQTATSLIEVLVGDPAKRSQAGIAYRDQVSEMVATYDVEKTYEDD